MSIRWHDWGREVFARSAAEDKPILLAIVAAWSDGCARMDGEAYADRAVAALVGERFLPVRVDADLRPDVADRYGLGGWPTTAFLTPEGEILGGGTYFDPPGLRRALEAVDAAFRTRRDEIRALVAAAAAAREHDDTGGPSSDASAPAISAEVIEPLCERASAELSSRRDAAGGAGGPPAAAIELLVRAGDLHGRADWLGAATAALDELAAGDLRDGDRGGFCWPLTAASPGSSGRMKLIEPNAALLAAYVAAWRATGRGEYRRQAEAIAGWAAGTMVDPAGGFRMFQRAGLPPAPAVYTDSSARMAAALMDAAAAFQDPPLAATAIAALERLVAAAYRPGDGLAHGPGAAAAVRGLLADQWAAAAALIAAHELTGDAVWAMLAEELARGSLRRHRDAARGGFFDRPPWNPAEDPPGLLRERIKPVRANAEAARVLRRLARLSGDGVLEDHARATLAWAGTLRGRTLEEAAACALAVID